MRGGSVCFLSIEIETREEHVRCGAASELETDLLSYKYRFTIGFYLLIHRF